MNNLLNNSRVVRGEIKSGIGILFEIEIIKTESDLSKSTWEMLEDAQSDYWEL